MSCAMSVKDRWRSLVVVSRAERVERVEDKECGNGIRRVGHLGQNVSTLSNRTPSSHNCDIILAL